MLELLVTSHGSSESRGVKQGTGCSRELRAANIPHGRRTEQVQREGRKDRKRKVEEEKQRRLVETRGERLFSKGKKRTKKSRLFRLRIKGKKG